MHQHLPRHDMVAVMDQDVLDDTPFEVCHGPMMGFDADLARGYCRAVDGRECGPAAKATEQYESGDKPPFGDSAHQWMGRHITWTMPVGNGRILGLRRKDTTLDAQA